MDPKVAQRRKIVEGSTMAMIVVSGIMATLGTAIIVYDESYLLRGTLLLAAAVFLFLAGLAVSFNLRIFSIVGKQTRGSARYERLRRWTRLKTSSILHNLLLIMGGLILLIGSIGRMGIISTQLDGRAADRALALFLWLAIMNALFAFYQSLRVELDPDRTAGNRTLFWTTLNVSGLLALFATYVAYYDVALDVIINLTGNDGPIILVAAFVLGGITLGVGRGIPGLFAIVSDPKTGIKGGYVSRQKSVVMPTMVAFTLLFIFILVIIISGAGIFGVAREVGQSGAILGVVGVLFLAAIAGVIVSLSLSQQEDKVELFKEKTEKEVKLSNTIALSSVSVALVLLFMAFMANQQDGFWRFPKSSWIHLAGFGAMLGLAPYGFYAGYRHKHIQNMEIRFPDFLRDLASSHKGGLTLVQSVQVAARGEYGGLTPEIQKLADQLSWNVSFEEAFRRFGDRVSTPLVQRSVNLVLEAGRSGGSTTDVLLAAARDAREIKSLERERKINMSVYTTVIYVTFFVFLFVIGVLVGQFLPAIIEAGAASEDSELGNIGAQAGLDLSGVSEDDYRQFYYIAGLVQAIGNGMLAGIMGSGRGTLGLRHAFIMVLFTYVAFAFIL